MNKVKRYEVTIRPADDGFYVLHADHAKEIAEHEQLHRKAGAIMEAMLCNPECCCTRCAAAQEWIACCKIPAVTVVRP